MPDYSEIKYSTFDDRPKSRNCLGFFTETKSLFYYCALISSWDDRSWYFLMGIYLVVLDPSNLILTAIFGFLSSGIVLFVGSVIGSWTDRSSRLKAAVIVLIVRNLSTLICSILLCLVLFFYDLVIFTNGSPTFRIVSQSILIIFGVLAHVAGLVNNNLLSKDWLPILCLNDSSLLSIMTSRFRLLDLVSKIVAPVIIGQIIYFAGKPAAVIVFSLQVLVTLGLLTFLLKVIYNRMPRLHFRDLSNMIGKVKDETASLLENENVHEIPELEIPSSYYSWYKCLIFFEGWIVYFKGGIKFAGLALALLYMTVLGFDTVTIGYAISQGVSESMLSYFNAGAAITGIIGALIFPKVMKMTNVIYTGIVSLSLQFIGLLPCLISVWASGSPFIVKYNSTNFVNVTGGSVPSFADNSGSLSIILLFTGIIASRTGLWMFDLTISQLLVETVSEINRGKVNGVQNSLNMLFEMIKFALVLVFPLPYQFGILVLLSVGAVGLGNVLYLVYAIRQKCKISSYL